MDQNYYDLDPEKAKDKEEEEEDDIIFAEEEGHEVRYWLSKNSSKRNSKNEEALTFSQQLESESQSQRSDDFDQRYKHKSKNLLRSRRQRQNARKEVNETVLYQKYLEEDDDSISETNKNNKEDSGQEDLFANIFQQQTDSNSKEQHIIEKATSQQNLPTIPQINSNLGCRKGDEETQKEAQKHYPNENATLGIQTNVINSPPETRKRSDLDLIPPCETRQRAEHLNPQDLNIENVHRETSPNLTFDFEDHRYTPTDEINGIEQASTPSILSSSNKKKIAKKRKQSKHGILENPFANNRKSESVLDTARKINNMRQKYNASKLRTKESRSMTQPSIHIQKAKSIVGSRPGHWGGRALTSTSSFQAKAKTTAKELSQATKLHSLTPSRIRVNRTPRKFGENLAHRNSTPQTPINNLKSHSLQQYLKSQTPTPSRNGNNGWGSNVNIRNINFRPSILNEMLTSPSQLPEVNDDDNDNTIGSQNYNATQGITNNSGTKSYNNHDLQSQEKRKKQKREKSMGLLIKQLRAIRSQDSGNWVRLRSGNYLFGSKDINDPRNRADIFIDVSILNDVPENVKVTTASLGTNDGCILFLLAYVHNKVHKVNEKHQYDFSGRRMKRKYDRVNQSPRRTSSKESAPLNQSIDVASYEGGKFTPYFAQICFNLNTLREQNICKGTKLRIYDCITIPSFRDPDSTQDEHDRSISFSSRMPTVVCTKLCEPYPDFLPPLSEVPPLFGKN